MFRPYFSFNKHVSKLFNLDYHVHNASIGSENEVLISNGLCVR